VRVVVVKSCVLRKSEWPGDYICPAWPWSSTLVLFEPSDATIILVASGKYARLESPAALEHTVPRLSTVPRQSHTIEIGCGPRARMDRLEAEHITMRSLRFVRRLEQGTPARLAFRLIYSSVRHISIKYTTRTRPQFTSFSR